MSDRTDEKRLKRADMHLTVLDPEQLEYLPATSLLRLVEKYQQAGKHFKAFKQALNDAPELFRAFEEFDIDVRFNLDNDYISFSFTGDGPKLTAVWKLLRQHGYKTEDHPKKGDTSFYAFWRQEGRPSLLMNFSSSMCRRVQVGTKLVEQPIYETQCGELPELDAPATAVVVTKEVDDDIPF